MHVRICDIIIFYELDTLRHVPDTYWTQSAILIFFIGFFYL